MNQAKPLTADEGRQERILQSLIPLVGEQLVEVHYLVLKELAAEFDVDAPNAWGCQAVSLSFEKGEILVEWGRSSEPQEGNWRITFQLEMSAQIGTHQIPDQLVSIKADQSHVWRGIVGYPVEAISVLGMEGSPQALKLSSANASAVIATGYANDSESQLIIGGGDDLLIFSGREWKRHFDILMAVEPWSELSWTKE